MNYRYHFWNFDVGSYGTEFILCQHHAHLQFAKTPANCAFEVVEGISSTDEPCVDCLKETYRGSKHQIPFRGW